ncbi:hypothetical protein [Streptomyces sp. NPDC056883]|uniref:hypothetical protein n=1 Tax=Streptomyces sp. NPDC056883 TaxID=3345959 RepID=UPI0036858B35
MNRPLVLVIDDAADVLAASPEARELVNELLRTGRRNGLAVRLEGRGPLPHWQYPTPSALEAATQQ